MDIIHEHRAHISKNYLRRIGVLVHEDRFGETYDSLIKFAAIVGLWERQDRLAQERAVKGLMYGKTQKAGK